MFYLSARDFTVPTSTKKTQNTLNRVFINNQIRAPQVKLIDEAGKQLGVMALADALLVARERKLDVIQVSEKVDPPICKLGDYGKFLYQQGKKERKASKRQGGELKEVRLSFNISPHDIETRVRQAEKFLGRGDRIRITLPLRGREKALEGYAREKVGKFIETLKPILQIKIERPLIREPRGLSMIVAKA